MIRRSTPVVVGFVALTCLCASSQQPPTFMPPEPDRFARYGDPDPIDLASLADSGMRYQDQPVTTQGVVRHLGGTQFLALQDGIARVLLIPSYELAGSGYLDTRPGRVEVRGVVRRIRPKEYINGKDLDLIEHPDLPVLPAPDTRLPSISLTALAVSDAEPIGGKRGRDAARDTIPELVLAPGEYLTRKVRVRGLFRGGNLFGDLPAASQRDPRDWILKEDDYALWVTGREPKGKGFALDPQYRGDTTRWLEVEGRIEARDGVVYLRANKVALVAAPKPEAEEDP